MIKNVGAVDRVARLCFAGLLAFLALTTAVEGWGEIIAYIVAAYLALTAILQWLAGSANAGIGLFSPLAMMLAASTRTSWDLLEYVGRARGEA